jgi:flagellar biosynthetic protein FliR
MTLQISDATLIAFLFALVRSGGWIAVAPPFNNVNIPPQVKVGIAAALALAVTPTLAGQIGSTVFDTSGILGGLLVQALAGLGLGLLVQLLMTAMTSAGSMIDLFGGFSISAAYDPNSNTSTPVWGRFYEMLMIVLLFAIDGHILLIHGFLASFHAIPLRSPSIAALASVTMSSVSTYFTAAAEIAAPMVAALFMAQIVMGMISRAAPQLNVLQLGASFTVLLTLLLAGLAIPLLPGAVSSLLDQGIHSMALLSH